MWRIRISFLIALLSFGHLTSGCSTTPSFTTAFEPWRETEERACLASGYVRETPYVVARASLGGPSACGAIRPFSMSATRDGSITLQPAALLRCPMIPAVEHWIATVVDPAARHYFGTGAQSLKVAASYGCRPMNNISGGRLSEHGHANALDVSSFRLSDGRSISVKSHWHSNTREAAFLRAVHSGACRMFTTVLGPEADRFHSDHFHLDLARRRSGNICK